jgi:hypothetical protein
MSRYDRTDAGKNAGKILFLGAGRWYLDFSFLLCAGAQMLHKAGPNLIDRILDLDQALCSMQIWCEDSKGHEKGRHKANNDQGEHPASECPVENLPGDA